MNKYSSLFNENMSDIEASNILFKTAKQLSNNKDKEELLEAFKENSLKISKRIDKEYGKTMLTNSSV